MILIQQGLNMMKIFTPNHMNKFNLSISIDHAMEITTNPLQTQWTRQACHLITAQEITHV